MALSQESGVQYYFNKDRTFHATVFVFAIFVAEQATAQNYPIPSARGANNTYLFEPQRNYP
jgi:hypothetical protein